MVVPLVKRRRQGWGVRLAEGSADFGLNIGGFCSTYSTYFLREVSVSKQSTETDVQYVEFRSVFRFRVWHSSVNNTNMITILRWTSLVNHSKKIDAWKQNSSKYDEDNKYYTSAVHPNYRLVTRKNLVFVHAASVWNEEKKCSNSLELFSPLLEALRMSTFKKLKQSRECFW